jgi:XTP/dITP diphosphohydrolase
MRLKVITSNPGKVAEYQRMFGDLGIEMEHVKIPYDEIQTAELEEVVLKGMEALRTAGLKDFIIDDSGVFIDELGGFPGVYSAYVQKTIGNEGILTLMDGVENRDAIFKCCIGCDLNGETIIVTGKCPGKVLHEARGTDGFGYDPIFSHDGKCSFAEIQLNEKNEISHRGNAFELLRKEIESRLKPIN